MANNDLAPKLEPVAEAKHLDPGVGHNYLAGKLDPGIVLKAGYQNLAGKLDPGN